MPEGVSSGAEGLSQNMVRQAHHERWKASFPFVLSLSKGPVGTLRLST